MGFLTDSLFQAAMYSVLLCMFTGIEYILGFHTESIQISFLTKILKFGLLFFWFWKSVESKKKADGSLKFSDILLTALAFSLISSLLSAPFYWFFSRAVVPNQSEFVLFESSLCLPFSPHFA